MAANLDIHLRRNEDWVVRMLLSADGAPIDLTGMTLAMQVRDKLNQALIATADIRIEDAAAGEIEVLLPAHEGTALSNYGNPIQTANLHYDLRLTDSDGVRVDLLAGLVILSRGETRQ